MCNNNWDIHVQKILEKKLILVFTSPKFSEFSTYFLLFYMTKCNNNWDIHVQKILEKKLILVFTSPKFSEFSTYFLLFYMTK